jgi:N-ethylmaleimide reductase
MAVSRLLSPGRLGDLMLPNRMLMCPMTRFRVTEEGVPTDLNIIYYGQRASAGLIITETAYPHPTGRLSPRVAGLYSPEQVAAWARITSAVADRGGRMFVQLCHAGRISHPRLQPNGELPMAPSPVAPNKPIRVHESEEAGLRFADPVVPRAMSHADIRAVIGYFRDATRRAEMAGFEGVELHAGSGFLHQQFLTRATNGRTDAYGRDARGRCRFVIETLEAMCEVRGPGRVGVKIAPNFAYNDIASDEAEIRETYACLAELLTPLGLAYVHVQYPPWGLFTGPKDLNPIDLVRASYPGTLVGAGEFDRHTGEAALRDERCDFVAFGRRFIANPDLPERFRRDAPENGWDESTLYAPSAEGFIDYPTLGDEQAGHGPTAFEDPMIAQRGLHG